MKKIYFKGYYGFKNLGDDIFTVTADWICNNLWEGHKPIFLGESLPKVSDSAKKIEIRNTSMRRLYEIIICLMSKNIIYYGGSLFSGGISGLKDLKYYLNKFSVFYPKLGTIGTSIGPFKNNYDLMATNELLNKFKFISVRDYSSIEYAKDMGLEKTSNFCFDNAILIKDVYPKLSNPVKLNNEKIRIAVSLCHYESYSGVGIENEIQRENSVLRLLEEIIKDNKIEEIVFIVFNGNSNTGDLDITTKFNEILKGKIKTRVINYSSDTEKMVTEINNCDIMIGIRLHSGILAYALNIPFILVEYHKKCTEFLNTINHNHRFIVNDIDNNVAAFNYLIEQNKVPDIVPPSYFRNVMIDNLNSIKQKL